MKLITPLGDRRLGDRAVHPTRFSVAAFKDLKMATHPLPMRNKIADIVTGLIDGGSGPGFLLLLTEPGVEAARLQFSKPSFSPAVDGVAEAFAINNDISAVGGVVAKARLVDSYDNPVLTCSVTKIGDGGDIQLSALQIGPGQEVSVTALSYVAPP